MIRWNNDYNQIAHEAVLQAVCATQGSAYAGYGMDELCKKAAEEIKKYLGGAEADVHFLLGGTQTNYTMIAAALRPYEAVVSADTGHIQVHETGAVENTGHKIHVLPSADGKITAEAIRAEGEALRQSPFKEHITHPKMVYISFPTESGTLYSKAELTAIRQACDEYGLYLYLDGARLSYGLAARENDVTMEDLARLCDAFYIGGTKCGAMFGEALVLLHKDFKCNFRNYIKQNGAMLAKGWLLGAQFDALFRDGLYFEIGKSAIDYALQIRDAFLQKGFEPYPQSPTNQQFFLLPAAVAETLGKKHIYEFEGTVPDGRLICRFCTGWHTKKEDVEALVQDVCAL